VVWGWAHGLVQYRDVFDNHTRFSLAERATGLPVGRQATLFFWMRFSMFPIYGLTLWLSLPAGQGPVLTPGRFLGRDHDRAFPPVFLWDRSSIAPMTCGPCSGACPDDSGDRPPVGRALFFCGLGSWRDAERVLENQPVAGLSGFFDGFAFLAWGVATFLQETCRPFVRLPIIRRMDRAAHHSRGHDRLVLLA